MIKSIAIILILSGLFFVRPFNLQAQEDSTKTQKRLIQILQAGLGTLNQNNGSSERRLINEVKIIDGNTTIQCDSAIHFITEGRIEAFGHIKITDKDQTILADRMIYDLTSDQSTFYGRVMLSEDSTLVISSEISYYKESDIVIFPKPFQLHRDSSYLYAESGIYFKEQDSAQVKGNVFTLFKEGLLSSDSLIYSKKNDFLSAFGSVYFEDEDQLNKINSDSLFVIADSLRKAFGDVFIQQIDSVSKDTSAIFSDELYIYRFNNEKNEKLQRVEAYGAVKQWSADISVLSDTLVVNKENDTLIWTGRPLLWKEDNQLSAQKLELVLKDKNPYQLTATGQAFNISPDSITARYNQLSSDQIKLTFREQENTLDQLRALGNSLAIYQSADQTNQGDGLIKISSKSIVITMNKEGEVDDVKSYDEINGSYMEESESLSQITLDGFNWLIEMKPSKPIQWPESTHKPFIFSPLFTLPTDWDIPTDLLERWNQAYHYLKIGTDQPLLKSPDND